MDLKIKTSIKNAEVANCLLARVVESIEEASQDKRKEVLDIWGLTVSDIQKAKAFRKSLVRGILNPS